jgi:hypothetical protein
VQKMSLDYRRPFIWISFERKTELLEILEPLEGDGMRP